MERKKQEQQQQQMMAMSQMGQTPGGGGPQGEQMEPEDNSAVEVQGGRGYNHLAHVINKTGTTEGQV